MANLMTLHVSHVSYNADHNGAQHVTWPHDLTAYGSNATQAIQYYEFTHGAGSIPRLWIGSNQCGRWYFTPLGAAFYNLLVPIGFPGLDSNPAAGFGAFRVLMSLESFQPYAHNELVEGLFLLTKAHLCAVHRALGNLDEAKKFLRQVEKFLVAQKEDELLAACRGEVA